MKLLIIPSLYPAFDDDNTGVFVRDQSRLLAQAHDVTVMVPRLVTARTLLGRTLRGRGDPASRLTAYTGPLTEIPVSILNVSNRWESLTRRRWRSRVEKRAAQLVATGVVPRPDIVHAHIVQPAGGVAAALARRWQSKAVLTEHSGPFSVHLQTGAKRCAAHAALHAMDAVVAVSPFLAAEISAAFPGIAPLVVGNVVDDAFFTPGLAEIARAPRQPFRFLFVGGLTWHKGVAYLLEAAAALRHAAGAGWQLVIVGNGPDRAALERQVSAAGLQGQVVFTGSLSRSGVRAWMRSSDVLVQPSVIETFCVVLIEAMACGIPVIATACGGPSWVVRPEGGALVPSRDAAALARAMHEASQGSLTRTREEIRLACVSRFGRAAWQLDMERVYRGVMGDGVKSE